MAGTGTYLPVRALSRLSSKVWNPGLASAGQVGDAVCVLLQLAPSPLPAVAWRLEIPCTDQGGKAHRQLLAATTAGLVHAAFTTPLS